MTLSRTSVLAFALGLVFVTIAKRKHVFFWISVFFILFLAGLPGLEGFFDWLLKVREGSTLGRMEIYLESLKQIQGIDAVLGYGYKPKMDLVSITSLGSHSTYLSLLFKTGFTGFIVFGLFQGALFWRWYRLKKQVLGDNHLLAFWAGLGGCFIGVLFWMTTDDLDAAQFVAFLYFSLVGFFEGFRRELSSAQELSLAYPMTAGLTFEGVTHRG
jgi:O-antigen ligase